MLQDVDGQEGYKWHILLGSSIDHSYFLSLLRKWPVFLSGCDNYYPGIITIKESCYGNLQCSPSGGENGPDRGSWKGAVWDHLITVLKISFLFIFVYPSFLLLRTPPTLCSKRLLPFLVEINVRFLVSWTGGRSEQSKKKDCWEGDPRRELY